MADLKHYPDTGAWQQTGTAQAVIDNAGRPGEDVGQIDSSRGAWRIPGFPTMKASVAVVLALWLAVVVLLGAAGAFVRPSGTPPYPIAVGVTMPVLVFLVALWVSASFRRFVTDGDVTLVTAIQAWRWAGFGLVGLDTYGVLPGRFA
jgi:hypothetical protein